MSDVTPTQKPSCFSRALGFILRLFFVLILGVVLGAGIFYGALYVYRQYIQVVQEHSWQLYELETRLEQLDSQTSQRLSDYQDRLETLEIQSDTGKATLAKFEGRLSALEAEWETLQGTLYDLAEAQAEQVDILVEINENLMDMGAQLDRLQGDVKALEKEAQSLAKSVTENSEDIETALTASETALAQGEDLQQQLALLRAMELLTRSRIYLFQDDYSLARADLLAAKELLSGLAEGAPEGQAEALEAINKFVDQAASNLPIAPLTAIKRLESAWELLVAGLPEEPLEMQPSSDETPAVTLQGTPSPTPSSTPSPTATRSP